MGIRQYAAITELDETVLHRLISKILIGEVRKTDEQKVQEVKIIYNFVEEIPPGPFVRKVFVFYPIYDRIRGKANNPAKPLCRKMRYGGGL